MQRETIFQVATNALRFGSGVTRELGFELQARGHRRVLVIMDPALRDLPSGETLRETLRDADIDFDIFDEVAIEPTDASFQRAAEVASSERFEAFVALGGGSTIDTAKAANLYSTWPADFDTYVNVPAGGGAPVPGPLKPLFALPTTAGTGSETTAVAVFDDLRKHVKTGISHPFLKPTLAMVDPDHTLTAPAAVMACAGLDVLSHALESYTAIPYTSRPRPRLPDQRPTYQGTNPISDIWSHRALQIVNQFLLRAVRDAEDIEARGQMLLAASLAGIGFGNAGVHLPHAMAYPVAGLVRSFQPAGYATHHPLVPHGMSVILHTAAVARFTAETDPPRHLQAAAALGADIRHAGDNDAGALLAERVRYFMAETGMPAGLAALGYTEQDIPALVEGTLYQRRIMRVSPRRAGADELAELFRASM